MAENKIWYLNTNNQTYGPYTRDEVISMLKDNSVKFSDYIFKEGFNGWEYIYNVKDFDRRLLFPGGDQPLVEVPKAATPVEQVETAKVQIKEGEDLWYVHDGENQLGPYTSSYIKEALNDKTLFWTYYIWREGFDNWVQIKNCREFDRRTKSRGESPVGLDITTDFNEIKEQAVNTIPKAEYGDVSQPANFQYGVSELEQEELKGRYPVKAIVSLIAITLVLFGVVRLYPWFIIRAKENKAMKMYDQGVAFIEQEKYSQGFNLLSDLSDMYPSTKAARKEQNYIRSKEPVIKAQLADEGRKVKKSIEEYVKKYGLLPANAIDISYIQPFWMKYFGEIYYKKDQSGKISVIVRGNKSPVDGYVFTLETSNNEMESDLTQAEFDSRVQGFIKLIHTGTRTNIKPVEMPQLLKKEITPQPQDTTKEKE
ncbi:MAG: DUF4339 domain-containing protein, partial [Proteobacteria bacterium]|nr:DUF4339 domain-containing protein [Pseudomonadota bacterium]